MVYIIFWPQKFDLGKKKTTLKCINDANLWISFASLALTNFAILSTRCKTHFKAYMNGAKIKLVVSILIYLILIWSLHALYGNYYIACTACNLLFLLECNTVFYISYVYNIIFILQISIAFCILMSEEIILLWHATVICV